VYQFSEIYKLAHCYKFFAAGACAGSSGAVHNVVLIDVYLDLENPGGSGFWVGKDGWGTEGTERVSLRASGS
jgi:hypothetical protein